MGASYVVKYWETRSAADPKHRQARIDALLERFDGQLSTWRDDSELSRFNGADVGQWMPVSNATALVAARALQLNRLTDGALDPTIGPVLKLWGFGPGGDRSRPLTAPDESMLRAARNLIGSQNIEVQTSPPALRKTRPGLTLDLSSVASGHAVDLVAELLIAEGVDGALVDIGGEMRGVGLRPDGQPWRVGIQAPAPGTSEIAIAVTLQDLALATSGDYHNARLVDGAPQSHIIDPRSGRPVPYRGASVTVIAESGLAADGLPTALFVMGPEAGRRWCIEHGVAAVFVERSGEGSMDVLCTPRFEELQARP
ncbi:MAG TPA: FAD:protein FMN transferase [Lacipirellulaceae bacterium]|nr:FAD:protein FMN transferase [Lacipirellulaceae bacterium]